MSDSSSLVKKLRIRPGNKVLTVNAPDNVTSALSDLTENALSKTFDGQFDVVLAFYKQQNDLNKDVESLKSAMGDTGILWVCYPKGASKVPTDLNRDILFEYLLGKNLRGVAMVAVDDIWSALRLKKV